MEDMEIESTETSQETVETTAPETPVETASEVATETQGTDGEVTEYAPNFKFNIKDQEYEMDEWVRGMVKDKDTEDKFRDVFTKAYALDGIKESREKLQNEYEGVNKNYSEINQSLDILRDHVGNKDFDSFFKALNIPKEWVQQWMHQDLQRGQLPAEQQAQYDARLNAVREATELRRTNNELTQQHEAFQRQAQETELQTALQEPTVNQVMQNYDRKIGQVGAFREKVVAYAIGQYHATGRDLTAKEAINEIMSFTNVHQAGVGQTPQAQSQVVAPQNKPVIPNIQGRSSSPVKKAPKSIEELKAQVKQMYGDS